MKSNEYKMDKNPSSLLSLAAKKLFERQFCTFKKLPLHTQKVIALKLIKAFRMEADQLTVDLFNLEYECRKHIRSKTDIIEKTLNQILRDWIKEVQHVQSRLAGLSCGMARYNRVQPDYRCLVFFRECFCSIKESIPFFKSEAVYPDPAVFLFSRFAIFSHRKQRHLYHSETNSSTSSDTTPSSSEGE